MLDSSGRTPTGGHTTQQHHNILSSTSMGHTYKLPSKTQLRDTPSRHHPTPTHPNKHSRHTLHTHQPTHVQPSNTSPDTPHQTHPLHTAQNTSLDTPSTLCGHLYLVTKLTYLSRHTHTLDAYTLHTHSGSCLLHMHDGQKISNLMHPATQTRAHHMHTAKGTQGKLEVCSKHLREDSEQ